MAAESEDDRLSIQLPPDLGSWLDERASEQGMEREEFLQRLLEASRLVLADEDGAGEGIVARIDALDDELDEKIADVRSRVLQVKRETDEKSPADHDHPEFERFDDIDAELSTLDARLTDTRDALKTETSDLEAELADIQADLDALQETVTGYDDEFETVNERLQRVAGAVVELKRSVGDTNADAQLADLKRIAAQRGFESARCDACSGTVDLSMLTEPACPHCEMALRDVTGNAGFFSTPTLVAEEEQ